VSHWHPVSEVRFKSESWNGCVGRLISQEACGGQASAYWYRSGSSLLATQNPLLPPRRILPWPVWMMKRLCPILGDRLGRQLGLSAFRMHLLPVATYFLNVAYGIGPGFHPQHPNKQMSK
jgi:hypothetical protein